MKNIPVKEAVRSCQACKHKTPNGRQRTDYRDYRSWYFTLQTVPQKKSSLIATSKGRRADLSSHNGEITGRTPTRPPSGSCRLLALCYHPYLSWTFVNTIRWVFWAASIVINTRVYGLANPPISLISFFARTLILSWSKKLTYSKRGAWRRSAGILSWKETRGVRVSAFLFSV